MPIVLAAALNAGAALLAWWALGSTLQFLVASLVIVTVTAPMLQPAGRSLLERAILMQVCCDAVATVWLIVFLSASWGVLSWLLAYLLLTGWNATVSGTAIALRWRVMPAIATAMGLAFLSWPIWLATWRGEHAERFAAYATTIHPVFALNALLPDLGTWTHLPLSYQLMSLGQDVPFMPPATLWPATLCWLLGAIGLWSGAVLRRRWLDRTPS
ncbi:MAG TPA: hypothetical protein PKB10_06050 [Tepidisphaeraceae bacterium]|nr:hypothetical protein [Tepidisphaeraceae bacterium]